jgi:hypothetical protein
MQIMIINSNIYKKRLYIGLNTLYLPIASDITEQLQRDL